MTNAGPHNLDEQYQDTKRTRFDHIVARLLDDLDSDSDADGMLSDDSFFVTQEQMILDLMAKIETTRVFDPMPCIPKASQLHFLDEWWALDHPNFHKKLRVEPDVFDGLHELIKDHMGLYEQYLRQTREQVNEFAESELESEEVQVGEFLQKQCLKLLLTKTLLLAPPTCFSYSEWEDTKPVNSSNLPFPRVTFRSEEREKKIIT
ncbi:hypothetical protein C8R44DRAFT_753425 [Mycena epipterygia]|nr:hypothetical protein C8R44DRAFT_753425 [Mycena epipterygia]